MVKLEDLIKMMGKYFNKPTDNIIRVVLGGGYSSYYNVYEREPVIYYIDVNGVKIKHTAEFAKNETIDGEYFAGGFSYTRDKLVVIRIKNAEIPKINYVDKTKYKINKAYIDYKKLLEDLEE